MSGRDLSKMGAANVALDVNDCGHQVIEKCPVGEVEYAFYQHAAMELNQAEIATPKLFSADASLRKLRMEYIPHRVEQAAVADHDALAMLGLLHRYPPNTEWLYHRHLWSALALEKSLIFLALPDKSAQLLRRFQQRSDVLFDYQSLVSGDSNAGNWGRRENGDLVLFDWERFGKGSPAIDLAPLIKGMGTKQTYIDLAERYCHLSGQHNSRALAREIAIAKAWIVTEVITLLDERQKTVFPFYLNWYKDHLPDWLDNVVEML
ncbi:phosphotransferase family protein [Dryocola sp. BD586]|uniref:phosphotransferase family protein n=1 Tax=Dryocola sp. BD586 TaxID=3133271 RepID=UPI003F4FF61D